MENKKTSLPHSTSCVRNAISVHPCAFMLPDNPREERSYLKVPLFVTRRDTSGVYGRFITLVITIRVKFVVKWKTSLCDEELPADNPIMWSAHMRRGNRRRVGRVQQTCF